MADDYKPSTRQEIYDRIRATSKDDVILTEMVRLGFWPARNASLPGDPPEEVKRRKELVDEIARLQQRLVKTTNLDALRREVRERRMRESTEKQQKTRERREQERKDRAAAHKARQERGISYLGEGVSGGLNERTGNDERLRQRGLPVFTDAADMARQMGLTVGQLRFLAFQRKVSTVHHYARFAMPKKAGGTRIISAPMPRLKKAQRWIVDHLLHKVPIHDAAHGFRPARSIVTNAAPHQRAAVVVNLDLQDFFPSVSYRRVRGLFRSLGYGEAFATVLALLCTEAEVDVVTLDDVRYFVATGPRKLPQGAPSSPALTNILCSRLDKRLRAVAQPLGFVYTRYADDLTFSAAPVAPTDGAKPQAPSPARLLRRVRFVIQAEGFQVHPDKTRVLRASRRQEVTGIVVNHHLSVDRETLRRFRALLFQIDRDGPAGKQWGDSSDVLSAAVGYANFVAMVTPDKGRPLRARALDLQARFGKRAAAPTAPTAPAPATAPATPAAAPEAPPAPSAPKTPTDKKWWKLF